MFSNFHADIFLKYQLFGLELLVVVPADEVIEHLFERLTINAFLQALLVLVLTIYLGLSHVNVFEKPVNVDEVVHHEDEWASYCEKYGISKTIRFALRANTLRIVHH